MNSIDTAGSGQVPAAALTPQKARRALVAEVRQEYANKTKFMRALVSLNNTCNAMDALPDKEAAERNFQQLDAHCRDVEEYDDATQLRYNGKTVEPLKSPSRAFQKLKIGNAAREAKTGAQVAGGGCSTAESRTWANVGMLKDSRNAAFAKCKEIAECSARLDADFDKHMLEVIASFGWKYDEGAFLRGNIRAPVVLPDDPEGIRQDLYSMWAEAFTGRFRARYEEGRVRRIEPVLQQLKGEFAAMSDDLEAAMGGRRQFWTLFQATSGSSDLQRMLRRPADRVDIAALKAELQSLTRVGQDSAAFSAEVDALLSYAADLDGKQVKTIARLGYELGLTEYALGSRSFSKGYQQTALDLPMIEVLEDLVGTTMLVRPERFMVAQTHHRAAEKSGPDKPGEGQKIVRVDIEGACALRLPGQRLRSGEIQMDSVYTPYSCFRVNSVEQKVDRKVYVSLTEVIAFTTQRDAATNVNF